MSLEKYWYEAAPFVYTACGGALLARADSTIMMVSAILLLTAGGTVMFLRRTHGLQARDQRRKQPSVTSSTAPLKMAGASLSPRGPASRSRSLSAR